MNRVGVGFDMHRLVEGRPLVLGGVKFDYPLGLAGHSDADVLVHALIDAMLGAAGLRDIGYHFPPGDDRYKGISSMDLLGQVRDMLDRERWILANADLVIIAEDPALAPYIETMRDKLAGALSVSRGQISIKATTTEGLGPCGRKEGIAAQAVVLLEKAAHTDPAGHEVK